MILIDLIGLKKIFCVQNSLHPKRMNKHAKTNSHLHYMTVVVLATRKKKQLPSTIKNFTSVFFLISDFAEYTNKKGPAYFFHQCPRHLCR